MLNAEITQQENKLTLKVENFKLHSKTYKHGYYNIKKPRLTLQPQETENKGIFLYTPRVTRKEVTCFYLDYITFTKPTNNETEAGETNWINQILPNTELTFKTIEEDTLKLKLEDMLDIYEFYSNYYPLFNTRYIDKNEQIYSMDNYFMEFVSLLMHTVYHEYNQELYTLFTGKQVYDIVTGATITDEEYIVNIKITNTKTGKPVTTGTLTLILDDIVYSSDDITTLLAGSTQSFKYNIEQDCQDHELQVIYTTNSGKETTSELQLTNKKDTTITVPDITAIQEDAIIITATITDIEGRPVNTGEITLDIQNFNTDLNPNFLRADVENGTATITLPGNYLANPLFPAGEYNATITYTDTNKCARYKTSTTSITIEITSSEVTGRYTWNQEAQILNVYLENTRCTDVEIHNDNQALLEWCSSNLNNTIYLVPTSHEEILQDNIEMYLPIAENTNSLTLTGYKVARSEISELDLNVADGSLELIIDFNDVAFIKGDVLTVFLPVVHDDEIVDWTSIELTENNEGE